MHCHGCDAKYHDFLRELGFSNGSSQTAPTHTNTTAQTSVARQRDDREWSTAEIQSAAPWKGFTFVEQYDYTSEDGALLFIAVRLTGRDGRKTFRQCRLVAPDRWQTNIDGVRRVLYRLPRVIEAARLNATVYVVEGEKDVHTLEALGLVATTSPMGANKWTPDLTESLVGANVVVLADNDDPGRRHAQTAATSCAQRGIPVKVVELPGLHEHGDVSDWLGTGRTPDELRAVVDAAEPWTAPPGLVHEIAHGDDDEPPTTRTVPPFPVEVLPAPVRRFVEEAAASMQCPADYIAVAVLATASAAVGAGHELKIKADWIERTALYAAIVAPPGSTKSPALLRTTKPLHAMQEEQTREYKAAAARHDAALEDYNRARASRSRSAATGPDRPEPPAHRRLVTSDSTQEALALMLSQNPRGLLLFQDELTAWVLGMNQYKRAGTDRQFYLSAWSGAPLYVDRKGSDSVEVPRPFLTVLGAIQPDMLGELADGRGREDGFLHRILFTYPDALPPGDFCERELTTEASSAWDDIVRALRDLPAPAAPYTFTDDGKAAWVEEMNSHRQRRRSADTPPHLLGVLSKLEPYAARFALLLHLLRRVCGETSDTRVDERSAISAWALVAYFADHAARIYPRLRASAGDRKIEAAVAWLRLRGGSCTLRDMQRANVANVTTAADARALADALVKAGWCRLVEDDGGGRTAAVLRLRPEAA